MLFRVILIILVVYLALRLLARLLAPFMVKKMVEKAQKRFEEQFQNPYYRQDPPETEPGKTYIDKGQRGGRVEDAEFEELD